MTLHPIAERIAEFLERYANRPPAGLDRAQFRHYVDTRRAETATLVEAVLPYAEGLLLPERIAGGSWGVTREMRPDGSGWRVTRFDADMVPMGHHSHERAAVAVEDVLGWADRTRMHQAQFGRHDITLTSAFQAWFGDSKVVDADGRPLVVYHGTGRDFEAFADNPNGIFFGTSPEVAASYSRINGEAPRIVPAYLSITNPWTMVEYGPDVPYSQRIDQSVPALKARGFDGFHDPRDGRWVAFRPEQIKSVHNYGAFDPANPNILFSQPAAPDENDIGLNDQPAPRRSRGMGW